MELPVEALNGHEGVLYGGLHGNFELALLLAKLEGYSFQDFGELPPGSLAKFADRKPKPRS
jgi:hypothetical protein